MHWEQVSNTATDRHYRAISRVTDREYEIRWNRDSKTDPWELWQMPKRKSQRPYIIISTPSLADAKEMGDRADTEP